MKISKSTFGEEFNFTDTLYTCLTELRLAFNLLCRLQPIVDEAKRSTTSVNLRNQLNETVQQIFYNVKAFGNHKKKQKKS